MAKLSELRKQAKSLGIAAAEIRNADTAEALEALIAGHGSNGTASKPQKKAAVRKAVAKKKTTATRKTTAVKKSASSKSAPARSRKSGTAKRPTTAKASTDGDSGRNLLDGVDYNQTEGWNARNDSAPDRIVKALKRFRGNREKVFGFLLPDVWDFMGKKHRDGTKRNKADAENMLRYRISRTAWDFAKATGQHDPATNRAKYGTGGTGRGVWKPSKKSAPAKKTSAAKKSSTARKTTATRKASATRKKTGTTRKTTGRKTASRRR